MLARMLVTVEGLQWNLSIVWSLLKAATSTTPGPSCTNPVLILFKMTWIEQPAI